MRKIQKATRILPACAASKSVIPPPNTALPRGGRPDDSKASSNAPNEQNSPPFIYLKTRRTYPHIPDAQLLRVSETAFGTALPSRAVSDHDRTT